MIRSLIVVGLLALASCGASADQQEALVDHAAEKVASGEWTKEQAREFLDERSIDWEGFSILIAAIGSTVFGGGVLLKRRIMSQVDVQRGTPKPLSRDQAQVLHLMIRERIAQDRVKMLRELAAEGLENELGREDLT